MLSAVNVRAPPGGREAVHKVAGEIGQAWATDPTRFRADNAPRITSGLQTCAGSLHHLSIWPARRWAAAAIVAAIAALLMGTPTDLIPTNLFERMTPVLWWNYPVWILSAVLTGLVAGTYIRTDTAARQDARPARTIAGGVVTVLAVGCPVCNKLVVLALGTGGALNFFSPLQPALAIAAVALLLATLIARLHRLAACPAPPASRP